MVGSNDLTVSRHFYDALLGHLGIRPGRPSGARLFYAGGGMAFGVCTPWDGGTACSANGGTIGFAAQNAEQVDAFHREGVTLGGTCEGAPGRRDSPFGTVYAAYLRDPDGNKICAVCRTLPA